MAQNKAAVFPSKTWSDSNAYVVPLPGDAVETLPLVNVSPGEMIVKKNDYPSGVVLIPPAPPPGDYVILPLETCKEGEETVEVGEPTNPNGVVVLFKSH